MTIKRFNAFDDNYIWGIESNKSFLIVDPGDSKPILDFFNSNPDKTLAGILITHHHSDHVGGIKELIDISNNKFFSTGMIEFGKTKKLNSIPVFGPIGFEKYGVNIPVKEADNFMFGRKHLTVLEIPGHTSNHIGYLCREGNNSLTTRLFCGDTLFAAGCGRILGGKVDDLYDSLLRLAELPDSTLVYCAHEYTLANIEFASQQFPDDVEIKLRKSLIENSRKDGMATVPTTIKEEKLTNPFLRCKSIDEFAAMRKAKDRWR